MSIVENRGDSVEIAGVSPLPSEIPYGTPVSQDDISDMVFFNLERGSATVEIPEFPSRMVTGMITAQNAVTTDTSQNAYLLIENIQLRHELDNIKEKIAEIEKRLPEEKTIVIREISRDTAKEEIKTLFSSGKVFYYSDLTQELNIDLELVVDICNELREEGVIGLDA